MPVGLVLLLRSRSGRWGMSRNWSDDPTQCGHSWAAQRGETIDYVDADGNKFTKAARGPHCCVKHVSHITDITNDDHRCCCGATHEDP